MPKKYHLGQLFRQYGEQYIKQYHPDLTQIKAIRSIRICRTPTLGGKLIHCTNCGHFHFIFKSCGNRNCPLCQNIKKEIWLDKIVQLELPVTHFHTVFTIPHELNDLVRSNQKLCFNILFRAASRTVKYLCAEKLNLLPGMLTVLHTWGQNLSFHPHVHCLIPNGGIDLTTNEWKKGQKNNFLIRPRSLRARFKKYFLQFLREAYENEKLEYHGKSQQYEDVENLRTLFRTVSEKKWVVWNQAPAKGVQQIHEYLARYVHRVAIADSRISDISNHEVSFSYKDYRKEDGQGKPQVEEMKLPVMEFIRRFLQHVLPLGFMKTRYYGILSSAWRKKLKILQQKLKVVIPTPRSTTVIVEKIIGHSLDECPACGVKDLVTFILLPSKGWFEKNCRGVSIKNKAPPKMRPNIIQQFEF